MADVWAGADQVLQRAVAVEVMRPDTGHEELFAQRFRDEAVHSAPLLHINIATLFDHGEDDSVALLVMKLVQGEPLSLLLRRRGALPPAEVRSPLGQAALALGVAAHEARVVHRDVKPANILVRPDGLVTLTDFGIARVLASAGHTRVGEMLGTPHYISPEQALGESTTGTTPRTPAPTARSCGSRTSVVPPCPGGPDLHLHTRPAPHRSSAVQADHRAAGLLTRLVGPVQPWLTSSS